MAQPTPPSESPPAAATSPGIELGNVPAANNASTNVSDTNTNGANLDVRDPSPLSRTDLFLDRDESKTIGRERSESIAASQNASDSIVRRLSKTFQDLDMPRGFLAATADMSSTVVAAARPPSGTRTRSPTVTNSEERIRTQEQLQQQRKASLKSGESNTLATLDERQHAASVDVLRKQDSDRAYSGKDGKAETSPTTPAVTGSAAAGESVALDADAEVPLYSEYVNGYHFPPKYSFGESARQGGVAFWHYFTTPVGFFVVLYGCNVVAWGGMLFLLLCNASPRMCHPTCNDINSPRRKWIEIDSQVVNGLFCVTGFGLAPWRLRDMYYYLQWRVAKKEQGLRRLAGVHRGWLRLPGSEDLPITTGPANVPPETPCSAIPFPESKIPDLPLTGQRAPPTRHWVIVFILCMNLGNTFLQAVLCGFMWGMNRYTRPSWSTGLFVALGCIAGALGGLGMFFEGKRVKGIEGVPLTDEDRAKLLRDREKGIYHYNNLKGKKPKEQVADPEAGQKR
ncbi:hypothetical protein SEPCBS119000_004871 [Sporothrix epigloea]|uniref:Alpha-l-rhamnosidase c n=1 Tax=Sporothrix epigloea TaxID=1892477 RepID=A0ABP0DUI0_9PEZI